MYNFIIKGNNVKGIKKFQPPEYSYPLTTRIGF
jgi:hypothetical protein